MQISERTAKSWHHNCPFSCCISPSQPQTISHLFLTCPVAATVTDWLCRLWQAMTRYLPVVSVAGLLAADTSSEQLPSDALLQTCHRLRLAVLHSIWTASQIAQAGQPTQPSDTSEPDAILFFFFFFGVQGNCPPSVRLRVRRRIFPWDRRTLVIIAEPQNARRIGRPSSFLLEQNSINS